MSADESNSSGLQSPASGDLALRCANIHRYLGQGEGRVHVLKGVSFEAHRGRVYAVVGPSGCGKSTLLYLLGLLDRQEEGDIWINGRLMSNSSDAERTAARGTNIGFVFQFHFLMQEFTALENVMMPMRKLVRLTESEMHDRAAQLLTAVGLGDKTHRLGSQLSGGEQQRVAIARAVAKNPLLLLCDEPTGALDSETGKQVIQLLLDINLQYQKTVVVITHNTAIAGISDKIIHMKNGEIENVTIDQRRKSIEEIEW
jgi:lipoprotein-releasing system ATP-binding protein